MDGEPSVAIFGGGIGGLSAAHELAERGIPVTVYDTRDAFGGKARSVPIGGQAASHQVTEPAADLHGEHGFRFFPAFYRNVTDTMERIPYGESGRVSDNLVPTEETLIAKVTGEEMRALTRTPRSIREWVQLLEPNIGGADVPQREVRYFLRRLLVLLTSSDRRRERQWEGTSWWSFIGADDHSPAYRKYLAQSTQALVALRPQLGSARTIGLIYLQLLLGQLDPSGPAERVLNGPTSEAWIGPWVEYLKGMGVEFRPGAALTELSVADGRISGATIQVNGRTETVTADYYLVAVPVEVLQGLVTEPLRRAAPSLGRIHRLETAWMSGIQFYLDEPVPVVRGHTVYSDSPWALTSISQGQFWESGDFDLADRSDGAVAEVLSVIASDWETPGVVYGKPARDCTPEQIKTEIWAQVTQHLNRAGQTRLDESHLVDWFLDPELVPTTEGVDNRAPLFINTVGSLPDRPEAGTEIENLLIAGDFVRTESDLATMESANEAARRAVNALIDRAGLSAPACEVWGLEEPAIFEPLRRQDAVNYRLGLPHPGETERSVRRFVDGVAPRVTGLARR